MRKRKQNSLQERFFGKSKTEETSESITKETPENLLSMRSSDLLSPVGFVV